MISLSYIINPSGGIIYHLRAIRYRTSLWVPFRREISRWLRSWNPSERELLIIGCSAGHCFDFDWAQRFEKIALNEPDPLARKIFAIRLRSSGYKGHIQVVKDNLIGPNELGTFQWSKTETALQRFEQSALLFSNCLGQLPFLTEGPTESESTLIHSSFEKWRDQLSAWLEKRNQSWASFHDLLSGGIEPKPTPIESQLMEESELIRTFYGHRSGGVLQDHFMMGFLPTYRRTLLNWALHRSRWHLIEAIHSNRMHSLINPTQ